MGLDKKKVTAIGRSLTVLGSIILCLIVVLVILSVKDPNVILA